MPVDRSELHRSAVQLPFQAARSLQVTLASGSITALPHVHAQMGLPLDFVRHVSCPSFYRHLADYKER